MKQKKPHIIIVVPSFKILGGVANHYEGLGHYWHDAKVSYVTYGKRKHIPAIIMLLPDLLLYIAKLIFSHVDVVVVNPSLRPYQLKRDGVYLRLALFFGKKAVTFIHGWDDSVMSQIKASPSRFVTVYGRSSRIYVLYSGFRNDLIEAGIPPDIIKLTTTKVDNSLVKGFDISSRDGQINSILFMARADKPKGLDITIKAFEILRKKYPDLELDVCGTGDQLDWAKEYVSSRDIGGVTFSGFVVGDDRIEHFKRSQIYILPTTHGEGMATSVLEAMAMGMVVISRPVGGVKDFFVQGEHGFLTESLDPQVYASFIDNVISDRSLTKRIAEANCKYAYDHFLASEVAKSLEGDLCELAVKGVLHGAVNELSGQNR